MKTKLESAHITDVLENKIAKVEKMPTLSNSQTLTIQNCKKKGNKIADITLAYSISEALELPKFPKPQQTHYGSHTGNVVDKNGKVKAVQKDTTMVYF